MVNIGLLFAVVDVHLDTGCFHGVHICIVNILSLFMIFITMISMSTAQENGSINETPHNRAWDIIISQATEVAFTISYPKRSRAVGHYNEIK